MSSVRKRIVVSGRVQGVGFRYFTASIARNLDLAGHARNEPDGAVLIEVEGESAAVEQFLLQVRRGPAHARVDSCHVEDLPPTGGLPPFAIER